MFTPTSDGLSLSPLPGLHGQAPADRPAGAVGPDAAEPVLPRGCGWFESSRELVQGIKVIEHQGFEGLSFEVPLAWQLAACC